MLHELCHRLPALCFRHTAAMWYVWEMWLPQWTLCRLIWLLSSKWQCYRYWAWSWSGVNCCSHSHQDVSRKTNKSRKKGRRVISSFLAASSSFFSQLWFSSFRWQPKYFHRKQNFQGNPLSLLLYFQRQNFPSTKLQPVLRHSLHPLLASTGWESGLLRPEVSRREFQNHHLSDVLNKCQQLSEPYIYPSQNIVHSKWICSIINCLQII